MDKDYAQYLLKKTTQDYNLIAEHFSSTRRFFWQDLESLTHFVIPREKVLDLGCGNGRLLQVFKDIDIDYSGIDSSERLIEIAKKHYPTKNFQVADAQRIPFPNNCFDKIYSIAVLHHIPSSELRLQFLKEANRALRPGGKAILTVWSLWNFKGWQLFLKYTALKLLGASKLDFKDIFVPWGESCQRYIHCFTLRELKKLAERAGFQVKETGVLRRKTGRESNFYLIAQK